MPGSFLLDTNAVIAVFAGDPLLQSVLVAAAKIATPTIALGELYYGANKSSRRQANVSRIDQFAAANDVLDVDPATAREYGAIKEQLRSKGRPLPENDIWIAAIAIQHGLTLVTRDAHFGDIAGLTLTSW